MPPSENGADFVRKILSRKEKVKEVKDVENPATSISHDEALDNSNIVPPPAKLSRFNQADTENDQIIEDVADLGNMTAADLRKTSTG